MTRPVLTMIAALCGVALAAPAAWAEIDGHGPDAWRVTGVARDDVLNMRMGPGTQYPVIDHLAPDARGLRQVTCVPLLIQPYYSALTEAERAALPPRWCLMRSSDPVRAGWVAQRFLMEDGLKEAAGQASAHASAPAMGTSGDPLIDTAQTLVHDLYAAFKASGSQADNPFAPANATDYFFADLVPALAGHGADLLYDAQDFQGEVTRIAPDPEQPMLRGMITINADFTNFGAEKRAVFRLRADTSRPEAPLRIFQIEHDGWSLPE